jgi:hypothetical protein
MATVAAAGGWMNIAVQRVEPERWFFPGPLGYEPGVPARTDGSGRRTGDTRGRRTEDGRPMAEGGRREEDRGYQRTEYGRRKTDDRRSEVSPLAAGISPREPAATQARGFLTRSFEGGPGPAGAAWERRNGRTAGVSFSHNLETVFPAGLYREHPEFFPLVEGRRFQPRPGAATNWQPDLGREDVAVYAAAAARKYFEANPQAESYSLAINDGLVFGESAETIAALQRGNREDRGQTTEGGSESGIGRPASGLAGQSPAARSASTWFRGRPDYSPLVFTFLNRAAAELEKTHPDKYLGALAYYWAENTPGFPVHPQVIPFLTADRSQGYDPAFWKEEMDLQERWAGALGIAPRPLGAEAGRQMTEDGPLKPSGGRGQMPDNGQRSTDRSSESALSPRSSAVQPRLGLYDYLDDPAFLVPRIHTRLIAEHIKHAWSVGFTDYSAEGPASWGIDGPMHWLVAQLTQDPTQSTEKLLEEYYRRMYGPAAGPMRAFFEKCEALWMQQPGPSYWLKYYYNEDQAGLFPAAARRELRGLLDEAAAAASASSKFQVTSDKYFARIALTSAAFSVTERYAEFQEARVALSRRVIAAGADRQTPEARGQMPEVSLQPSVVGPQASVLDDADSILRDFQSYLEAKAAFLSTVARVRREQPLAIAPFELRDFVKNDPAAAALIAIAAASSKGQGASDKVAEDGGQRPDDGGQRTEDERRTTAGALAASAIGGPSSGFGPLSSAIFAKLRQLPWLPAGWEELFRPTTAPRRELVQNGNLMGPLRPARQIAGLPYAITLPGEWGSTLEPVQDHRAGFVPADDPTQPWLQFTNPRTLRIEGTKDASVSQWDGIPEDRGPRTEGGTIAMTGDRGQKTDGRGQKAEDGGLRADGGAVWITGSVQIRGKVSPGNLTVLTLGWMDTNQRSLDFSTMRLPEGVWPEWVTLQQGGQPPAGARAVGIGVRIEHQTGDDWVEVRDFSLRF